MINPVPHDAAAIAARLAVWKDHLTPLEYLALELLTARRGAVVTYDQLWAYLYPSPVPYAATRDNLLLRQRIHNLRRALGRASDIVTCPAFGYSLLRFDGIVLATADALVVRPRRLGEPRGFDPVDLTPLAGEFARAFARAGRS